MDRKLIFTLAPAATLVVALAACSTGTTASAPVATQPVAVATLAVTVAPEATATPGPAATPATTSGSGGGDASPPPVDPCDLITKEQASAAIGKTLGAGVSSYLDQDRVCTFKSGTSEVKLILAPKAPDAATAQAYWDSERAQAPADLPITDLTLFDRSAYGSADGAGISVSAMFVIKGTWFFDFFCGFPSCTQQASIIAAQTIVGNLP